MMKPKIINLFEFGAWTKYEGNHKNLEEFQQFLNKIWNNRHTETLNYDEDSVLAYDQEEAKEQGFLKIKYPSREIRARNYVGVIRFDGLIINILPKVFKIEKTIPNEKDLKNIHAHLLWWLSYCMKLNFPKTWSNFAPIKSNFFEILIFLFANYTKEILSKLLYQTYRETQNELPYMKGRLDMNRYIRQNLTKANWHRLSCVYDSFELDNRFNRIIKHVAKLLLSATQSKDNKRLLSDIIFTLDEVSDYRMTVQDCQKVQISPLYRELHPILDYCRLFLSNSTVLQYKNELEVFAFLLPTERIFEDFVSGFIKTHLGHTFKYVQSQKSDKYLASLWYGDQKEKEKVFQLQHDIFITKKDNSCIIIDTKYKKIYTDINGEDKKHGISQSDLYQMISYAIRRNCTDIKLIYPNTASTDFIEENITFKVKDGLANNQVISIGIHQIPVLDMAMNIETKQHLNKSFEPLETRLIKVLKNILEEKNT